MANPKNNTSFKLFEKDKIDSNIILSIHNLCIKYKTLTETVYAVNGVSFEVFKGRALGLVGETGAGKTTTLLSILQLLPKQGFINKGEIFFKNDNIDILKLKTKDMEKIRGNNISMVFQDPMASLNPIFTIGDQIAETIRKHSQASMDEARIKSREMLQEVGITSKRYNSFPHEFSGGMIQRVMIAIALACKPSLIMLDEPTTALDVTIQAQILTLLEKLKNQYDTSMIFVTHNLNIVPSLCEEVAVMYCGFIVEEGTIDEVYTNPLHPYTKGLFACIPDFDRPEKHITPIPGMVMSAKEPYKRCPFWDRCNKRIKECEYNIPQQVAISKYHKVACFRYSSEINKNILRERCNDI